MEYQLAQLNIAKFRLPQEDPVNADFINNIDRVNATAETQPGFVWRFTGDGNDALDVQAYEDANILVNMSVWDDIQTLFAFVYQHSDHTEIMRRRKEWFDKIDFHMVLWWIEKDCFPTLNEAKKRLDLLRQNGPTPSAFTFKNAFPAPNTTVVDNNE